MCMSIEPCDSPCHIDANCCQYLLQCRFRQADISASSHAEGSHALRESAFHARSYPVTLLPRGLMHSSARLIEGFVLWARMEVDASTLFLGLRAKALSRATAAISSAEANMDARPSSFIDALRPANTDLALRTRYLLARPVDLEVWQVIALARRRCPVSTHRSLQGNTMIALAAYEQISTDIG